MSGRLLSRLNPLTPLATATLLVALAYVGPAWWGAAVALTLALTLAAASGIGARVAALALAVGVPTLLLLFLMNGVIAPAGPVRPVGLLRVAPDALPGALAVALPLSAAVAALGWIVLGVEPRRLMRAIAERGLPAWAAYVLVASLEAVPQARRRADEVLEAQRSRGLTIRGGTMGRVRALVPLAGPLMVSMVTEAEERAIALDARGFVPGRRRTALAPVPDPRAERLARLVIWTLVALLLAWRILLPLVVRG